MLSLYRYFDLSFHYLDINMDHSFHKYVHFAQNFYLFIALQEVLLFPAMKPDDPNKNNPEEEKTTETVPLQNGQ